MASKSEAGMKLDKINRDDKVENEISLYNSPKQTVYNIETHII